ncbi:hypothetical protein D3C72_2559150 [compost metagenome]
MEVTLARLQVEARKAVEKHALGIAPGAGGRMAGIETVPGAAAGETLVDARELAHQIVEVLAL